MSSRLVDREKRNIIGIVTNESRTSAVDITKDLEKYKPISIQHETVRNVLRDSDRYSCMCAYVQVRKTKSF